MFRNHAADAADAALFAGLALLLALFTAGAFGVSNLHFEHTSVAVEMVNDPVDGSIVGPQGTLQLTEHAGRETIVELRFKLPPRDADSTSWVLWLQRAPVDAIWVDGTGPDGQPWRSAEYDFFRPDADEPALPVGYVFRLPADWQGDIHLRMHVRSAVRSALHPMLLTEHQLARISHLDIALNAGAYASLFMLALIVLMLYAVTRERAFVAAFACTSLGLLFMSAANGHLLQLPGFSLFSAWRSQGLWVLLLLFSASLLQLLLRYAHLRGGTVPVVRWFQGYSFALIALAAVCLLDLPPLRPWAQSVATTSWVVTGIAALFILVDAVRRRWPWPAGCWARCWRRWVWRLQAKPRSGAC